MSTIWRTVTLWAGLAVMAVAGATPSGPPASPAEEIGQVLHGVRVADPWRWLEATDDARVQAWIDAQNAWTEARLGKTPELEALGARVQALSATGVTRFGPRLAGGTLFFFQHTPPQAQPVVMAQSWPDGEARVLVDPNRAGGDLAITEVWPSPSGRWLAYGTAEDGNELTTIHVLDVSSGNPLPDTLPHAGGATTAPGLAWDENVFDDFHAAMLALLGSGWTDRAHLGIMGGSNGGLLVGASLIQHPEAFRAGVAQVGIFDSLRHESHFTNGKYNVSEYGSIEDPEQFRATLAYSPLHNVAPGTAYPALLLTTGLNDARVAAWQSHKFATALQTATASQAPILVFTRKQAGHGIGAPFAQRVGNTALALAFLAQQLGLDRP